MFQGRSALTLDAKGRMSIPSKHRDGLVDSATGETTITLTMHFEGFVLVFPHHVWIEKAKVIAQYDEEKRGLRRQLLGYAVDLDIDASGRILVPPELREAAGLTKEVVMIGMGGNLEIWNPERLKARELADQVTPISLAGISL